MYYEVLDIPLPELQCLKTLKVAFHYATKDEVSLRLPILCNSTTVPKFCVSNGMFITIRQVIILNVRLPKLSTVEDVLNEIKTKVRMVPTII